MKEMKTLAIGNDEFIIMDELARPINNITTLKSLLNLKIGDVIKTLGFYNVNDGGGATYLIRERLSSDVEDGSTHFINDTLVAEIILGKEVKPIQFGILENGDIANLLNKVSCDVNLDGKSYTLNSVVIPKTTKIKNGEITSTITGSILMTFNNKENIVIENLKMSSENAYNNGTPEGSTSIDANGYSTLILIKNSKHIKIIDSEISYSDRGILIVDSEFIEVSNNIFDYSKNGALILGSDKYNTSLTVDTIGCRHSKIYNNIFRNGYEGIKLSQYIFDCDVFNNECYSNLRDGFDYAGHYVNGLYIHNNRVHDNGQNGIEFKTLNIEEFITTISERLAKNIHIYDNNVAVKVSGGSGINLRSEGQVPVFANVHNNFVDCQSDGNRGIRIWCGNYNHEIIVHDNQIFGNSKQSYGIDLINTARCKIFKNRVNNFNICGIKCSDYESDSIQVRFSEITDNFIHTTGAYPCIEICNLFKDTHVTNNTLYNNGTTDLIIDNGVDNFTLYNIFYKKITAYSSGNMTLESGNLKTHKGLIILCKDFNITDSVGLVACDSADKNSATYKKYIVLE